MSECLKEPVNLPEIHLTKIPLERKRFGKPIIHKVRNSMVYKLRSQELDSGFKFQLHHFQLHHFHDLG